MFHLLCFPHNISHVVEEATELNSETVEIWEQTFLLMLWFLETLWSLRTDTYNSKGFLWKDYNEKQTPISLLRTQMSVILPPELTIALHTHCTLDESCLLDMLCPLRIKWCFFSLRRYIYIQGNDYMKKVTNLWGVQIKIHRRHYLTLYRFKS